MLHPHPHTSSPSEKQRMSLSVTVAESVEPATSWVCFGEELGVEGVLAACSLSGPGVCPVGSDAVQTRIPGWRCL